ncbi:hypothetical protein [Roseivivax marinus]|uniref:hypothetical protein n=1 Tax=Roseivivax marinus TaxID=1379903 RepID=UPI00103F195A|nr:hypothetical protein [Roseivivax marinus]
MSDSTPEFRSESPYKQFRSEVWRRTSKPLSDATFIFYVVFGILIFGGLGVWIEVMKIILSPGGSNWRGILTALAAFYPALIGAACLQLVLESVRKSEKLMAVFSVGVLLLTIIAAVVFGVFEFNSVYTGVSFWGTIFLSITGIWVWCVANGDNPDLQTTDPYAPSGGDTSRKLKGDTSGFRE